MTTPTSMSRFSPVSTRTPEDCEQYYLQEHTRWARSMLRAEPAYEAYHIARATSRYADGAFGAEPTRWRYVLLRRRPGLSPTFDAAAEEHIAEDHRRFLQDWHGFACEQRVLLDRRSGQTAFAAYLVEWHVGTGTRADADEALAGVLATIEASDAFGLRFVSVDTVLTETAGEAIDQPGQRPVRTPLPTTRALAHALVLFDQHEWAQEWFATPAVRAALDDDRLETVAHHVQLECGFDER